MEEDEQESLAERWGATDELEGWEASEVFDLVRSIDRFEDGWRAPPTAQSVTFWVVLRDGRNGTDWKSFVVDVR